MSFGLFVIGFAILTIGLAFGAHLAQMPPKWIGVGVVCLLGLGIVYGVTATRQKDQPS